MNFIKIWILNDSTDQNLGSEATPTLFNLDNIVSIKPIRIVKGKKVIDGYWIRTINNKKYRATQIPEVLAGQFNGDRLNASLIKEIDAANREFKKSQPSKDSLQ